MLNKRYFFIYSLLMTAVVVASNFLVQHPVNGVLAGINLADLLTFGAFTYPIAFLVTDLTNRQFGPQVARRVVSCRSCSPRRASRSRPARPSWSASFSTSRSSTVCASSPGGRRR